MGFSAAQQISLHIVRTEPQAERGECIQRGPITATLGIDQQIAQHLAEQQRAVAVFHGPNPGHQSGLMRESCEQPLRKSVDRINPEAAARTIEHLSEQRAGTVLHLRREIRTDCLQILRQDFRFGPHPAGQNLVDPASHLGCAGLGESQADYLRRGNIALQQQPQYAGGKHLGLTRPSRGGQPDCFARVDCRELIALKLPNFCRTAHPASSSRMARACHSSSRINWSKSL